MLLGQVDWHGVMSPSTEKEKTSLSRFTQDECSFPSILLCNRSIRSANRPSMGNQIKLTEEEKKIYKAKLGDLNIFL